MNNTKPNTKINELLILAEFYFNNIHGSHKELTISVDKLIVENNNGDAEYVEMEFNFENMEKLQRWIEHAEGVTPNNNPNIIINYFKTSTLFRV